MTKYTITKCRAVFTRCGYAVQLLNDDGTPYTRYLTVEGAKSSWGAMARFGDSAPAFFFGNDGRKVRAEAIAFAKTYNATLA
jgi:hypothetical protein